MATLPADKLARAVSGILQDYADDVAVTMEQAVKKVASEGAKALRAESKRTFTPRRKRGKHYYQTWTSTTSSTRRGASATIYNSENYQLAHLLEFGHANRAGGRTEGRVHIATIEREVVDAFEKEVLSAL